jgi:hypothetical protein
MEGVNFQVEKWEIVASVSSHTLSVQEISCTDRAQGADDVEEYENLIAHQSSCVRNDYLILLCEEVLREPG